MKNEFKSKSSIVIDAPASVVWDALTNPKLIKEYFFGTDAKSDWNVGSEITFSGEWEGKSYRDKGTILEKKDKRLLSYTHFSPSTGAEDKPENYYTITYELSEKNGQTKVTITQENNRDKKMKEHSEEIWNKVLSNLKDLLENELVDSEEKNDE